MRIRTQGCMVGLMIAAGISIGGCGGSGSGEIPDGAGTLSLSVSDGPVHEALKVCIEFQEIEIKGEGPAELVVLPDPVSVNLLAVPGNNSAPILMSHQLDAGDYQWLRLGIDADRDGVMAMDDGTGTDCQDAGSYIVFKEQEMGYPLYVPSSAQNGLKLVGGITVPSNSSVNLTAEFDLAKSVTRPPGLSPDVVMRPVIHLVNDFEVGTLTGQVDEDFATAVLEDGTACTPRVYVFDDMVEPNGLELDDDGQVVPDPEDRFAEAPVEEQVQDDESIEYHYTVGFLLAGDYEVAFTCDGENFEPPEGKPATIVAGELETVDFLKDPEPAP